MKEKEQRTNTLDFSGCCAIQDGKENFNFFT